VCAQPSAGPGFQTRAAPWRSLARETFSLALSLLGEYDFRPARRSGGLAAEPGWIFSFPRTRMHESNFNLGAQFLRLAPTRPDRARRVSVWLTSRCTGAPLSPQELGLQVGALCGRAALGLRGDGDQRILTAGVGRERSA